MKKMKILLTYCSIDIRHRDENTWDYESVNAHYPLGLAYLYSYLEGLDRGYEVETQYLNNTTTEECLDLVEEEIKRFQPDVLGLSLISHSRIGAYRVIEMVQKKYPNIHIVLGGMHVSVMYEQLAEAYRGIVCVIGEGEITLGELIECWDNGRPINNVNGIAFHDGEKTVITPERALISDLDILPFPKHELFLKENQEVATMLSSRGCPYKCNFCVLDSVSRRKVRCRSAENIVDEIVHIMKNYPTINTIWLHDDAFMIIKERTIEFCKEIIKRGVKVKLICSARFRPISREVVMLMKEAGFVHVLFGLESGSPAVLKQMKKGLTQKAVRHGLKLFSETKIKATAFLIVGLPGETAETVDETIEFVQELQDIHYLAYDDIGVAQAYPGTELYTLMKKAKTPVGDYGPIDDGYWLTDGKAPHYITDHSYEQLLEWKEKTRDAISFYRIANAPENFLKQRKLMASIIEYCWREDYNTLTELMCKLLGEQSVEFQNKFVKAAFLGEKPEAEIHIIREELEAAMGLSLFDSENMNQSEKDEFVVKYLQQVLEDDITLARWQAIQKEERSGFEGAHPKSAAVITTKGDLIDPAESPSPEGYSQYPNRLKIIQ